MQGPQRLYLTRQIVFTTREGIGWHWPRCRARRALEHVEARRRCGSGKRAFLTLTPARRAPTRNQTASETEVRSAEEKARARQRPSRKSGESAASTRR